MRSHLLEQLSFFPFELGAEGVDLLFLLFGHLFLDLCLLFLEASRQFLSQFVAFSFEFVLPHLLHFLLLFLSTTLTAQPVQVFLQHFLVDANLLDLTRGHPQCTLLLVNQSPQLTGFRFVTFQMSNLKARKSPVCSILSINRFYRVLFTENTQLTVHKFQVPSAGATDPTGTLSAAGFSQQKDPICILC
jgi:hypothetical protein